MLDGRCGELDMDGFLRLCAEKEIFSGCYCVPNPLLPYLSFTLGLASVAGAGPPTNGEENPAQIPQIFDAAISDQRQQLTPQQIELARDAFNEADEELCAVSSQDYGLCIA